MTKNTKKTDYFTAEHDQTIGDKWSAIFGSTKKFMEIVPTAIEKGKLFFNQAIDDKKIVYTGLAYSNNSNISILTVVEEQNGKKDTSVATICPLMKGINNKIVLKENFTWKTSDAEGEFAGKTDLEKTINFYDPIYPVDMKNFKINDVQTISLAGLAYTLRKLKEQEHTINKGGFYDFQLKEFLEKNPNKTKEDFEAPKISLRADTFRMFLSTNFACEYQIVGQIEDIKYIDFLGIKMAVLKVNLEHTKDDEFLYCNIYVSEYILKDYAPKIGDGIESVIWLTGFFN